MTLTEVEKNELNDSAFAYVEPGGAKDATGRTAPRVLRHLPYKTASGDVDLDLLALALNAVPDTNLPRATQAKVAARLESVAQRYQKSEGVEKYITHEGGSWKVRAESGRVLGTHGSKAEAAAQLAAVEASKHDREKSEGVEKIGWTDEARAAAAAARAAGRDPSKANQNPFAKPEQNPFHKVLTTHGFKPVSSQVKQNRLVPQRADADWTEHRYEHPDRGKSHVLVSQYHGQTGPYKDDPPVSWHFRHEQSNGIMAPTLGNTRPHLDRSLTREYGAPTKKSGGSVRWPVMPRPGFRGSSLTDAGEKAPNQTSGDVEKVGWTDEARAAAAEARKKIQADSKAHQAFVHGARGDGTLSSEHPTAEGTPGPPKVHAALASHGWHPITRNPGATNYGHPSFPSHAVRVGDDGTWAHSKQSAPIGMVKPAFVSRGPDAKSLQSHLRSTFPQKRSLDEVAKEWFARAAEKGDKPEWSDDAKASSDEAGKHGFEEDLKTDAGARMSHASGTHLFVAPSGKWHHGDARGETLGAGTGAAKLGEHLGKQPDHLGALPAEAATTKPAAPAIPGQPRPAPGKDPDFDKAYADFKAQVKSAVREAAGPGSRVQALVFDKERYTKPAEAAAWANDHGFEGKKVVEAGASYRAQQHDTGQFERLRTIDLTEGVKAVVGFPGKTLKAVRDAFFLTATGRLAFKRADVVKAECEPVSETDLGTVWRVKCAGQSLHFASAGGSAAYLPAYEQLAKATWTTVCKAEEQRYTLAVCYPASGKGSESPDFHGDIMRPEELEKAAWGYMSKGQDRVGLMHRPGTAGAGKVVESYIWRGPEWKMADTSGQEQTVHPGDWMLGVVWSPEAWAAVKGGTITGYSLQGAAQKFAVESD